MAIANTVIVVGSGWEARIPVLSAADGHQLLVKILTMASDRVDVPQAIQDGDGNLCAFIIPSEVKVAKMETSVTPKITQEQMAQEHMAMLKAQRAYFESHTRNDEF